LTTNVTRARPATRGMHESIAGLDLAQTGTAAIQVDFHHDTLWSPAKFSDFHEGARKK
jgi:hypothetical protein